MKINDRYINEACRIREDFIEIMESIKKHEKNIEENKTIISEIMKNSSDYIENNPKKNESQIKEDLKEQFIQDNKEAFEDFCNQAYEEQND